MVWQKTVLAAGLGVLDLLVGQSLRLPIRPSPAILLKFEVAQALLNGIVSNADMEARQGDTCKLIAAEDYIDDTQGEFVDTHLGWAHDRTTLKEQQEYVTNFLMGEDAWDLECLD